MTVNNYESWLKAEMKWQRNFVNYQRLPAEKRTQEALLAFMERALFQYQQMNSDKVLLQNDKGERFETDNLSTITEFVSRRGYKVMEKS
jgi:hypothetical protein